MKRGVVVFIIASILFFLALGLFFGKNVVERISKNAESNNQVLNNVVEGMNSNEEILNNEENKTVEENEEELSFEERFWQDRINDSF